MRGNEQGAEEKKVQDFGYLGWRKMKTLSLERIRNEKIRGAAHDKVRVSTLRWFELVQRRDGEYIGRNWESDIKIDADDDPHVHCLTSSSGFCRGEYSDGGATSFVTRNKHSNAAGGLSREPRGPPRQFGRNAYVWKPPHSRSPGTIRTIKHST